MRSPSYEEAIYMASIKRDRAKQAISDIVERYGVISMETVPGLDILLDYFVNMIYAIELLMKVLARDWDGPKPTKFRHDVGAMYREIFGRDYLKSDLLKELEGAIVDQKFIYEPCGDLSNRVPEIEGLWDELKDEYHQREGGNVHHLRKTIKMNKEFGEYLQRNVERFYVARPLRLNHWTKDEKIQMVEAEVRFLKERLEQLRASADSEEPDYQKQIQENNRAYVDKLRGLSSCMAMNFEMWRTSEIEFSTHMIRSVEDDFLG